MAKYQYSLEKGQPRRLKINTRFDFNGAIVYFDGIQIYDIPDGKTLKNGVDIQLPDGSPLHIQLQQKLPSFALIVTRYGAPLPGSNTDPATMLKVAYEILYFIAGLNMIGGLLGIITHDSFIALMGFGWASLIEGALYLVLAIFTQRKSKAALITAIVLYVLDSLFIFIGSATNGNNIGGAVILRIIVLVAMFPGIKAIDELKGKVLPPPLHDDVAH
jgi:hypothetical protein